MSRPKFDAQKTLSEINARAKAAERQIVQKIEVEIATEGSHIYDSTAELREAILKGEVAKSFRARIIQYKNGDPLPSKNWRTVEKVALASTDLRSLYRPVWNYTLKFLLYAALVGIALKAIDTSITFFSVNPEIGVLWILLIGAHILSVKLPLSIPLAWGGLFLLSLAENAPNFCLIFFIAGLTTAFVGFIFGAPFGMIIGTIVGHFKREGDKAPDAVPEGSRPYLLGIILPIVFLLVLIPFYLWFNRMIIVWLQK